MWIPVAEYKSSQAPIWLETIHIHFLIMLLNRHSIRSLIIHTRDCADGKNPLGLSYYFGLVYGESKQEPTVS